MCNQTSSKPTNMETLHLIYSLHMVRCRLTQDGTCLQGTRRNIRPRLLNIIRVNPEFALCGLRLRNSAIFQQDTGHYNLSIVISVNVGLLHMLWQITSCRSRLR